MGQAKSELNKCFSVGGIKFQHSTITFHAQKNQIKCVKLKMIYTLQYGLFIVNAVTKAANSTEQTMLKQKNYTLKIFIADIIKRF